LLDFLSVLIRLFLAAYSSAARAWMSLPVVVTVGAIAPAGAHERGCRVDRDRSLRESNGAGATAGRRMGPATGP